MTTPTRPLASSAVGMAFGAAALILITAIFVAALAAVRVDHQVNNVVERLEAVTAQQAAMSKADDARQQNTLQARRTLMRQNRNLRTQIAALSELLRSQGIEIPAAVSEPPPAPAPGPAVVPPKGPAPGPSAAPGSPAPTVPGPASPSATDLPCMLLAPLCDP